MIKTVRFKRMAANDQQFAGFVLERMQQADSAHEFKPVHLTAYCATILKRAEAVVHQIMHDADTAHFGGGKLEINERAMTLAALLIALAGSEPLEEDCV